MDLSNTEVLEKLYVISCVLVGLDEEEKSTWANDCTGLDWFGRALVRISVVADFFPQDLPVRDRGMIEEIVRKNVFCFFQQDEVAQFRVRLSEVSENLNIDACIDLADRVVKRLHAVGLEFPRFKPSSALQLVLENQHLVSPEYPKREYYAEHIPRCVLYTERLEAVLRNPELIDDEYSSWQKDAVGVISKARLDHCTFLEKALKTVIYDGAQIRPADFANKILITDEPMLQAMAQYIVPWDDYDFEQTKNMTTNKERSAYHFEKVYACFSVIKSCFTVPDALVEVMKQSRKNHRRNNPKSVAVVYYGSDSYMYSRVFSGILKLQEDITPNIGYHIRRPVAIAVRPVRRRNIKQIAEELRISMGLPEDDCKIIRDMGGKTPDEVTRALAKRDEWRDRVNSFTFLKKDEPVEIAADERPEETFIEPEGKTTIYTSELVVKYPHRILIPGTIEVDAVDSSKETAALSSEENLEETPEKVSSLEPQGKTTIYTSEFIFVFRFAHHIVETRMKNDKFVSYSQFEVGKPNLKSKSVVRLRFARYPPPKLQFSQVNLRSHKLAEGE
jgi:hypothetical protein